MIASSTESQTLRLRGTGAPAATLRNLNPFVDQAACTWGWFTHAIRARYAMVDGCLGISLKSIFRGVVTEIVQVPRTTFNACVWAVPRIMIMVRKKQATTMDSLTMILRWGSTTKKSLCYYGRFRAGALGRENCWVSSLTDRCASALTPFPSPAPPRPARVGIDDEDEDVEEEPSSLVRKVLFISWGSDVSTLRVAKGLAPSTEDRRPPAVL